MPCTSAVETVPMAVIIIHAGPAILIYACAKLEHTVCERTYDGDKQTNTMTDTTSTALLTNVGPPHLWSIISNYYYRLSGLEQ